MKPLLDMYHFILLAAWVTSGGCWPTFEAEQKLDVRKVQNLQPRGPYTINNSTISSQTIELSRTINTTLAILMFILVVVTYSLLTKYTSTLSNEIILPSKFLEDNIAAVLSLTWQDHFNKSQEHEFDLSLSWVLFCRGPPNSSINRQSYAALGYRDVKEKIHFSKFEKKFVVIIKTFSPIMKSLVQVAIWNSISFWLVVIMVVNTLVYNGFVSHNITRDSWIRLALVLIYAVANLGHQCRTTVLLYRNFTFVLFQACWKFISRAFVFLDSVDYEAYLKKYNDIGLSDMVWASLNLELFGTTECSVCYQSYEAEAGDDKSWYSHLKERDKTECKFDKFIKPVRDAEIKAYEKATDSALEKALANVAVLLGICLATALAPWTSTQTIDATGAQLGSYALLLSISTGLLALVSSISQLTNATDSGKTLLLLQEKTIEAAIKSDYIDSLREEEVSNRFSLREIPKFGFSNGIAGQSRLTFFGLWRSTSFFGKLFCLSFGSASILIPRFHGDRQSFEKIHSSMTEFFLKVKDITFGYRIIAPGSVFGQIIRPVQYTPPPDERINQMQEKQRMEMKILHDSLVQHQSENSEKIEKPNTSNAHSSLASL